MQSNLRCLFDGSLFSVLQILELWKNHIFFFSVWFEKQMEEAIGFKKNHFFISSKLETFTLTNAAEICFHGLTEEMTLLLLRCN